MRKTRTQKPARKFVALKARLAVEALLRFRKLPAIVKDASIHVCSATSQWTWYFKETETGDLEITLAMVLEEISESEMKANLMQAVHPVGTELQILRAAGAETSLALAKRVVRTAPDPMEIIHWSMACENAFLGTVTK